MPKTVRVLLVDDDLYIRELYQELLQNEGYEIDTAIEGKTGLEKMMEGGYDVVVLDVMMPQLDGLGILEKLKDNPPKNPNGKVVLLTNLANDPVVKDAIKLENVFTCLIKADITPDQFLQIVKQALAAK